MASFSLSLTRMRSAMCISWPFVLPVMEESAKLGACHDLSSGTMFGMEKSSILMPYFFLYLFVSRQGFYFLSSFCQGRQFVYQGSTNFTPFGTSNWKTSSSMG